jgi:hypothetical protein
VKASPGQELFGPYVVNLTTPEAQQAWREYSESMDAVAQRCSQRHADALRMVVVHEEPSPLGRAYLVREALTWLADWWKLR